MTEKDLRSLVSTSIITECLEGQIRTVDDSIPYLVEDIIHFNNSAKPLIIREVSESPMKKTDEFVIGKGKGLIIQTEKNNLEVEKVEQNSVSNSADLVAEEIINMEILEDIENNNIFSLLQHVNEEGNVVTTKDMSLIANEERQQELEIIIDVTEIKSTVIPDSFNSMNTTNQYVVSQKSTFNEDNSDKFGKYGETIEDCPEFYIYIEFKLQKELKSLGNVSLPSKLRKGELIKRKGSGSFPTSIPK
ncbi:hypothetical protein MA16_Dca024838 [Dendrobium catenatum]|uniref:Uncharacterized protein n=1 Tax=Dendrobium catenatum TaxID=906689 RepID=A0A2I0VAW6_9ASPA|nr:hypothetical protein MA16_Dca024838 [Dendrobium catenatum]